MIFHMDYVIPKKKTKDLIIHFIDEKPASKAKRDYTAPTGCEVYLYGKTVILTPKLSLVRFLLSLSIYAFKYKYISALIDFLNMSFIFVHVNLHT